MYKKVITLAIVFVLATKMIVTYDSVCAKDNQDTEGKVDTLTDTSIENNDTNDNQIIDDDSEKKEDLIIADEEKK